MLQKPDIETIARQGGRRWRSLLLWIVVALAVAAGLWLWLGRADTAPGTRYSTQPADIADIVVTVTATGTVEPTNQVDISSELSGRIRSVEVDYNDHVAVGEPLAQLDTDKLEANVESARAALLARQAAVAQAEATVNETRDNHERAVSLEQKGISSRESLLAAKAAFERAKAALDSARADVKVAEANLRLEQTNLDKACICSPIDGIVLSRAAEPGQTVASSLQAPILFTLAEDLARMQLTVDIDEADIGKVKVGDPAEFTVEAFQDRAFHATITQLRFAPLTVDGVVTYEGVLEVDNSGLVLRPGMTATAEITVERMEGVLAVPNAALRFTPPSTGPTQASRGGGLLGMIMPRPPRSEQATAVVATRDGWRPLYVLKDGVAVAVQVRTGPTDGTVTRIVEGDLKAGDAVIVDLETGK